MENIIWNKHHNVAAVVTVTPDDFPLNPREEFDRVGKMICFHKRYSLGDKHNLSVEQAKELQDSNDVISLPLYLYDHSGITMSTSPFSCPWDSGCVGFIYVTKKDAVKEFGNKICTKLVKERAIRSLVSEVEEYDAYLRGDVYMFNISLYEFSEGVDTSDITTDNIEEFAEGIDTESCGGFFGEKYCEEDAMETARHMLKGHDNE